LPDFGWTLSLER
jgi:hypothetical protein